MRDCGCELEQRRERRGLGAQLQQLSDELEQQRVVPGGLGITEDEPCAEPHDEIGAKGDVFLP